MSTESEYIQQIVDLHRQRWYLEQKLNALGYEVDYSTEVPRITRKDTDDDDRE